MKYFQRLIFNPNKSFHLVGTLLSPELNVQKKSENSLWELHLTSIPQFASVFWRIWLPRDKVSDLSCIAAAGCVL